MRKAASRVAEGYLRCSGRHPPGPPRARRLPPLTRRRLAALNIGNAPVLRAHLTWSPGPATTATTGRRTTASISDALVTEADQTPLIVDWRAPVAEPFYRRHRRRAHGVDAAWPSRPTAGSCSASTTRSSTPPPPTRPASRSWGGRAVAALDRHRTGRMGDIVAAIQAEQDEAGPAGRHPGRRGPGTGKTAVASTARVSAVHTGSGCVLRRAARRAEPDLPPLHRQVLPSLGEGDVQLTTVAGLKPQLRARAPEPTALAALKGDPRMAQVIARALRDRERPLRDDLVVMLDGHVLRLRRADSARIVERVRRRRGTHNERRPAVTRMVLDQLREQYRRSLVAAYERDMRRIDPDTELPPSPTDEDELLDVPVAAALARGERAPEDWEAELSARLRRTPRSAASNACGRRCRAPSSCTTCSAFRAYPLGNERHSLGTSSSSSPGPLLERAQVAWTPADVALIDEADALLGPRRQDAAAGAAARASRPPSRTLSGSSRSSGWGATRRRPRSSSATAVARRRVRTAWVSRARSGTCSWTKRRISPRCNGAWWAGAARRGR